MPVTPRQLHDHLDNDMRCRNASGVPAVLLLLDEPGVTHYRIRADGVDTFGSAVTLLQLVNQIWANLDYYRLVNYDHFVRYVKRRFSASHDTRP